MAIVIGSLHTGYGQARLIISIGRLEFKITRWVNDQPPMPLNEGDERRD